MEVKRKLKLSLIILAVLAFTASLVWAVSAQMPGTPEPPLGRLLRETQKPTLAAAQEERVAQQASHYSSATVVTGAKRRCLIK